MRALQMVVPVYGAYRYVEDTVLSALNHADKQRVITIHLIDDNSPNSPKEFADLAKKLQTGLRSTQEIIATRLPTNKQLTWVLNKGLSLSLGDPEAMVFLANSDLVFPEGYDYAFEEGLDKGFDLLGPVSNAPGTEPIQHVGLYSNLYQAHRNMMDYHLVCEDVSKHFAGSDPMPVKTINGFCMVALAKTWDANRFDKLHVFRPENKLNSKGHINPTPLMTLQEYELQGRWIDDGLKIGILPGCYVFHYRSVSRGMKFVKGDWTRHPE